MKSSYNVTAMRQSFRRGYGIFHLNRSRLTILVLLVATILHCILSDQLFDPQNLYEISATDINASALELAQNLRKINQLTPSNQEIVDWLSELGPDGADIYLSFGGTARYCSWCHLEPELTLATYEWYFMTKAILFSAIDLAAVGLSLVLTQVSYSGILVALIVILTGLGHFTIMDVDEIDTVSDRIKFLAYTKLLVAGSMILLAMYIWSYAPNNENDKIRKRLDTLYGTMAGTRAVHRVVSQNKALSAQSQQFWSQLAQFDRIAWPMVHEKHPPTKREAEIVDNSLQKIMVGDNQSIYSIRDPIEG